MPQHMKDGIATTPNVNTRGKEKKESKQTTKGVYTNKKIKISQDAVETQTRLSKAVQRTGIKKTKHTPNKKKNV